MDASTILSFGLFLLAIFWLWKRKPNSVPGPIGLPIVGYMPFMTSKPYIVLQKLAKKYGPVFSVKLGRLNMIVLNDFQSTKDAFSQDSFIGRPEEIPFILNKATLDTKAFNGLPWKDQRRFSLQILRDLGFGKSHLENMIKEEINELMKLLEKLVSKPTVLRKILAPSMSNNIGSLIFGRRLPFDHPDREMLDRIITETSADAGQTAWQIFLPWVSKILSFIRKGPEQRLAESSEEFKRYIRNEIKEHEKTLDKNNIRDYIDGYLLEIGKRKDPAFCKGVLEDMIGSFFGAGSETVRITLEWLLLTMVAYPDVQRRVQAEIDDVVGSSRVPSKDDQSHMPYTQATINELMRWKTIVPLNLLRSTLWDTKLNGFLIPKGSIILSNLWAVHHNADYWGQDVDEFRPERFLTENGKEVKKCEHFVPFSIGKRSCPGESFAKTEVFLYFASLLQKFNVALPAGSTPNLEEQLGIGLTPIPQELILQKRN